MALPNIRAKISQNTKFAVGTRQPFLIKIAVRTLVKAQIDLNLIFSNLYKLSLFSKSLSPIFIQTMYFDNPLDDNLLIKKQKNVHFRTFLPSFLEEYQLRPIITLF